jgi:tRNA G18 (ribose-2'-O)-methylase SpoU
MKRESYRHMVQRYQKERQRNVLAVPGPHPFVLVLDGLKAGYNVGKIFRCAQAFGARAVHLVGIGPFDPAPAKGALRKVPAFFYEEIDPCIARLQQEDYTIFLLDPAGEELLPTAVLPERSAFVFGHEEFGLSIDRAAFPGLRSLAIPRCGEVQSLNVSVAAAIVMYEYVRGRMPATGWPDASPAPS